VAGATDDDNLKDPKKRTVAATTLLVLLVLLATIGGGVGNGVAVLGFAAFAVGAYAVVRGRASWVNIASRRVGAAALVGGFAVMGVGTAVSPPTQNTASEAAAPSSSAAPSSTSRPAATSATPAPKAQLAAPVTTTQAPPPPPAPVPVLAMSCPGGGSVAAPVFAEQITATAPYSVTIDYGDGDRYTNDDQHLGAVFSHTYKVSGNFTVSAVLTDATGQTASASCAYSWTKPAPAPVVSSGGGSSGAGSSSGSSGGSSSGSSGGSTTGDSYVNVDGNVVQAPVEAPSAPPGATAQCNDGTWSFSQHRSGTCSGHGGVASWL